MCVAVISIRMTLYKIIGGILKLGKILKWNFSVFLFYFNLQSPLKNSS